MTNADDPGEGEDALAPARPAPDPLFQRQTLSAFPGLDPGLRPDGPVAGQVTRLLATGVLGVAAMVGCGSSGGPNCPTPSPQQNRTQTCVSSDGTHYVYVPGHGWSARGSRGGIGSGGHGRSGS
ncbi:MAG: hypothetical protein JOZ41_21245 [Chloroflexi bacterium]|nr:hypothetical protein [Chloroflexota bacterium]